MLNVTEKIPLLPSFFAAPLRILPATAHTILLTKFLNRALSEQIKADELYFLNNKRLCISVKDAGIKFYLSFVNGRLINVGAKEKNDVEITACIYDFLQIAARQQDPDSLVFQRRLIMQGDTELALELKNFLDAVDLSASSGFVKIEAALLRLLPVYKRLFS